VVVLGGVVTPGAVPCSGWLRARPRVHPEVSSVGAFGGIVTFSAGSGSGWVGEGSKAITLRIGGHRHPSELKLVVFVLSHQFWRLVLDVVSFPLVLRCAGMIHAREAFCSCRAVSIEAGGKAGSGLLARWAYQVSTGGLSRGFGGTFEVGGAHLRCWQVLLIALLGGLKLVNWS
jgi:hypothetical protein